MKIKDNANNREYYNRNKRVDDSKSHEDDVHSRTNT